MFEIKLIPNLDYRYYVDPEIPEIWRVKKDGTRVKLNFYTLKSGYQLVGLRVGGKSKHFYVHRIVWMTANNRHIPKTHQINHIDYNRSNNKISNLELLTIQENLAYSYEHKKNNRAGKILLLKDGVPIKEFDSHKECAEYVGCNSYNITDRLTGKVKRTFNGYTFKRLEK